MNDRPASTTPLPLQIDCRLHRMMSTWFVNGIKKIRNDDIVIAYGTYHTMLFERIFFSVLKRSCRFVGPTGAGKSYVRGYLSGRESVGTYTGIQYIDLLAGQSGRRTGHSLSATTTRIEAIRVKHPTYGDRIVLVDTPGFNDTARTSMQVLQMISTWLQKT